MRITYQSQNYAADKIRKRYVRRTTAAGGYDFCEVGDDRRYDLRQGTVEPHELPDNVRQAADELYKTSCHYVDWPLI